MPATGYTPGQPSQRIGPSVTADKLEQTLGRRNEVEGIQTEEDLAFPKDTGSLQKAIATEWGTQVSDKQLGYRTAFLWWVHVIALIFLGVSAIVWAALAFWFTLANYRTVTTFREWNAISLQFETRLKQSVLIRLDYFLAANALITMIAILVQFFGFRIMYFTDVLVYQRNFWRWVFNAYGGGALFSAVLMFAGGERHIWVVTGSWILFGVSSVCYGFTERYTRRSLVIRRVKSDGWPGNNVKIAPFFVASLASIFLLIVLITDFQASLSSNTKKYPILGILVFAFYAFGKIVQWFVNAFFHVWAIPAPARDAAGLNNNIKLSHSTFFWVEIVNITISYFWDLVVIGWLIVGQFIKDAM